MTSPLESPAIGLQRALGLGARLARALRPALQLGGLFSACASRSVEVVSVAQLEQRMQREVQERRAPAVVVAFIGTDGQVVARAAGHAQLQPARAAQPSTACPWFSATKLFTAFAVLRLVDEGRVRLDEPASTYVPSFRPLGVGVPTVRQLLAHTSGLANPIPITWAHLVTEPGPDLDLFATRVLHGHRELKHEPGANYAYSNLNYLVLGQLIERVTGQRYEQYVQTSVLEPLGVTGSGFTLPRDAAVGYSRSWSMMDILGRIMLDAKFFGPSTQGYTALQPFLIDGAPYGGLVGPVEDLLLLGRAMLDQGVVAERRVLSAELVALALRATQTNDGEFVPMGLGWHLGVAGDEHYAYHQGGGAGFRSELRIYPSRGYAIAVIANETSYDTTALTRLVVR